VFSADANLPNIINPEERISIKTHIEGQQAAALKAKGEANLAEGGTPA
jgi:hypothetical protein